jgi:hypothetical protein
MIWKAEEVGKEVIKNDWEGTFVWMLHKLQEHD